MPSEISGAPDFQDLRTPRTPKMNSMAHAGYKMVAPISTAVWSGGANTPSEVSVDGSAKFRTTRTLKLNSLACRGGG